MKGNVLTSSSKINRERIWEAHKISKILRIRLGSYIARSTPHRQSPGWYREDSTSATLGHQMLWLEWSESHLVVSDSLWPHGLYSPWNSPGQNTGVGSLSLLQGIFPAEGWNPVPLHCRWALYQLSHKGSHKGKHIPRIKLGWLPTSC